MKSPQLKKQTNHLSPSSYTKGIKLKFENIMTQEQLHTLTINDSINIGHVYQFLEQVIKEDNSPHHEIFEMNYQMLKKMKKIIKEKENQQNQQNKIKFRIFKSANKNVSNFGFNIRKKQYDVESKTFLSQEHQQTSKENRMQFGRKVHAIKNLDKNESIGQLKELNLITSEAIVKKLKNQLKKLNLNYSQICTKNEVLASKLKEAEEEKQSLQSKLEKIQKQQKIKLQLKFSLKCIEKQPVTTIDQTQNNSPLSVNSQQNKNKPIHKYEQEVEKKQEKCYEKLYYQQKQKHLQLIIVAQSKELQQLQKKLVQKSDYLLKEKEDRKRG